MVNFHGLVRLILGFVVCLVWIGAVRAETIAATAGSATPVTATSWVCGSSSVTFATCQLAGRNWVGPTPTYSTCRDIGGSAFSADFTSPSTNVVCYPTCPGGSAAGTATGTATSQPAHPGCKGTAAWTCPANQGWTLSGSNCTRPDCPAGQTRMTTGGTCVSACTLGPNDQIGAGRYGFPYPYPTGVTFCVNGCTAYAGGQGTIAGNIHYMYAYVNGAGGAASSCVGGGEVVPNVDAASGENLGNPSVNACISAGQGFGTVNGVVVCTGPATTVDKTKTTDKTTPVTGPATTTEKTTTTVCTTSGSCTQTTTTNSTTGGTSTPGPTTAKDETKTTFCQDNPQSPLCVQSSFSGACGTPPACDGDAVQCVQAAQAWQIRCDISTEPDSAAYVHGKSISEGGADSVISPLDPSQVVDVDVGAIVSGAGAVRTLSASCIPNQTITVQGHSYTMDTTLFCQFASIVGYLMVAASSVIAIRMIAT